MPKRPIDLPSGGRLAELDLVIHGRRGPDHPLPFSPAQLEQIRRTVRGVPEVMVKVSGGGRDAASVRTHLSYIDRHGKLEVHTDEGERLQGKAVPAQLVDDWNLEVGKGQHRPQPKPGAKDRRPKQVHNLVFSMPAGTQPDKLLVATQNFARENFGMRHRYAMVLHTDQKHPHVHVVVKAQGEHGERLNIYKATLTQWRADFARQLREVGVAVNATPTAVRGKNKAWKRDGIYRALRRGESTVVRGRVETVAEELRRGRLIPEPGKDKLLATRATVVGGWQGTAALLRAHGLDALAKEVEAYVQRLPAVTTEKENIATGLLSQLGNRPPRGHAAERDRSAGERSR